MYRADPFKAEGYLRSNKSSQTAERDEFQRSLASALILRQPDGAVKSPVITLCTEPTCVYSILEKHLRAEALLGTDRWWRICKSLYRPPLEVFVTYQAACPDIFLDLYIDCATPGLIKLIGKAIKSELVVETWSY